MWTVNTALSLVSRPQFSDIDNLLVDKSRRNRRSLGKATMQGSGLGTGDWTGQAP